MSTPYPLQLELHADGRITRWRPLVGTTGVLLLADWSVLDPLLSHSVAKPEREALRT
jgi:hypothetical protein